MTPQIIYLILITLSLGMTMAKHGEPRENHNFWHSLIATVIGLWLLIAGGFFKCFGWD